MPARKVRVRRAATGLGLFAAKPIAKKAYIATYRGKRIPTKNAHDREWRSGAKYMFELNSRWTIDGSSRGNMARYANHSCRPNAESALSKGQLILRAIEAIEAGEEITYDYGEEYFDLLIKPVGCKCAWCGAQNLRRRKSD